VKAPVLGDNVEALSNYYPACQVRRCSTMFNAVVKKKEKSLYR